MCALLLYFHCGILIIIVSPFLATSRRPTVFPLMPCGSQSGDIVTLGCLATGFNPPAVTFSWNKGGTALTDLIQYTAVQKGNVYTGVSQVRVRRQDWDARQTFQCAVRHAAGNGQASFQKPCKLLISGPTTEDMLVRKKGTIKCAVTVQKDAPQITWEDEKLGDIASNPVTKVEDNGNTYVSKLDITYDEWTTVVTRFCVVHHSDLIEPLREPYKRDFGNPQRPSVFMLPPLEQTNKAEVTLTCFVKDFFPKEVFVSWLVDDEEADSSYAFNTTEPIENNGFYSAYGQLFVSLDQWQRDGAVYSCVVYHESVVNTTRAIVRSIGSCLHLNHFVSFMFVVQSQCYPNVDSSMFGLFIQ
uniref:Ig-like domain-containing protein n=1 Tax=Oreochromis niloticus TaxID=8128 RepID=A0A669BTB6_ORENI